jgi:thiol-disulfide isomerase/thioredoxin
MSKLERLAHMAFVAVCFVSIVLMIEARFRQPVISLEHGTERGPAKSIQGPVVGEQMSLPGVHWSSYPVSVVLVLSPTCHFCADSMPFYRRLAKAHDRNRGVPAMVVSTAASVDGMRTELTRNGISVDTVLNTGPAILGVRATPTIFVVDAKGTVRGVFVGELNSADEAKVLNLIGQIGA